MYNIASVNVCSGAFEGMLLVILFPLHIFMQVNDSDCNSLDLYVSPGKGYTVKGFAEFNGPVLTGWIELVRFNQNRFYTKFLS